MSIIAITADECASSMDACRFTSSMALAQMPESSQSVSNVRHKSCKPSSCEACPQLPTLILMCSNLWCDAGSMRGT